jgi:hypothetical protein
MLFLAIVNLAISAIFLYLIKAPLMRAYLVVNYILIVNPMFMWTVFGLAHPRFIPGHDSYIEALMFMASFNLVLCLSFIMLMRTLPRSQIALRAIVGHRLNFQVSPKGLMGVTLLMAAVGLIFKFQLDAMGGLRMGGRGADGPFLQAVKVFSSFDLMALVLLGESRLAYKDRSRLMNLALVGLFGASLLVALATGSRSQSVTVLIVGLLAYRDKVQQFGLIIYPLMAVMMAPVFTLFPLLAYYRGNNFDIVEARYLFERSGVGVWDVVKDVIVTRLNYNEPLARVVDYADFHGPAGGQVYWNNLIGIVPRLIWPGKPQIENDSKELGHQLGLVALNDTETSIGLQVVGEAFYEFGWLGLWVAAFQALIFTMIHKNFFRPGNPAAMTVYTILVFYILQRDGYFAVVPGLIWQMIGFTFFFFGLSLFMRRARTPMLHDSVSYRFTHR